MYVNAVGLTQDLQAWYGGCPHALDRVITKAYKDLYQIAQKILKGHKQDRLYTGDVLHEAYRSLASSRKVHCQNSEHFYRLAARAMRAVIVREIRQQQTRKRQGECHCLPYNDEENTLLQDDSPQDLLLINDMIESLENKDPSLARLIEFRYFYGFSKQEIAAILNLSTRTIERRMIFARAWVVNQLGQRS